MLANTKEGGAIPSTLATPGPGRPEPEGPQRRVSLRVTQLVDAVSTPVGRVLTWVARARAVSTRPAPCDTVHDRRCQRDGRNAIALRRDN